MPFELNAFYIDGEEHISMSGHCFVLEDLNGSLIRVWCGGVI